VLDYGELRVRIVNEPGEGRGRSRACGGNTQLKGVRAVSHVSILLFGGDRNTKCALGTEMEGGNGVSFIREAGEVSSMLFKAIGTSEGGGFAAGMDWLIIPSLHASLISTTVGFSAVCTCAKWAGGEFLLAKLGGMAELRAVAALCYWRGRKHFCTLTGAGKESDGVGEYGCLVRGD